MHETRFWKVNGEKLLTKSRRSLSYAETRMYLALSRCSRTGTETHEWKKKSKSHSTLVLPVSPGGTGKKDEATILAGAF